MKRPLGKLLNTGKLLVSTRRTPFHVRQCNPKCDPCTHLNTRPLSSSVIKRPLGKLLNINP